MLIGAGITLHTCLATADILAQDGIAARVIDTYSIKPIDGATLAAAAASTAGRIVVAEDHHPEGGLGSAVIDSLIAGGVTGVHLAHLAVREMPSSGTGETAARLGRNRRRPHRSRRPQTHRQRQPGARCRP